MQHSNKAEKMGSSRKAAWGETIDKKGDKRNKRVRDRNAKRDIWQN